LVFLLESKFKNHCHCLTFYRYAKMETFEKIKYYASNPMSHVQQKHAIDIHIDMIQFIKSCLTFSKQGYKLNGSLLSNQKANYLNISLNQRPPCAHNNIQPILLPTCLLSLLLTQPPFP
jgi:hypothetical protein